MGSAPNIKFTPKDEKEMEQLLSVKDFSTERFERIAELNAKKELNQAPDRLSENAKNFIIGRYINQKYGSRYIYLTDNPSSSVKAMNNGSKRETTALRIISKVNGEQYYKYKKRLDDGYVIGSIDGINARKIQDATKIIEIKGVSTPTKLMYLLKNGIINAHFYQMQSYMSIFKKDIVELNYILLPPPESDVLEQKVLYFNKYKEVYSEEMLVKMWKKDERRMKFLDIPTKDRVVSFTIQRNQSIIDLIHKKVALARFFLYEFDEINKERILNPLSKIISTPKAKK